MYKGNIFFEKMPPPLKKKKKKILGLPLKESSKRSYTRMNTSILHGFV